MDIVDFDYLLWSMSQWDAQAFIQFDGVMRERVVEWLRGFGLSESAIAIECPRCLLELGILAVRRKGEIPPGHFLTWSHAMTRNLVVRYWREEELASTQVPLLTAAQIRVLTAQFDGSALVYEYVATRLKVSADWLKHRYETLQNWASSS